MFAEYIDFICSSSQTGGPAVTAAGDIEMQAFSVSKKVQSLVFFIIWVIVNITYMN